MKAEANRFLTSLQWTCRSPEFSAATEAGETPPPGPLSSRAFGTPVVDHRSSWVRRGRIGTQDCYVKTYDYPQLRDRLRGVGRNTVFARSRAQREWDALCWLRAQGLDGPRPLAVGEARSLGLLRRAVLVTSAWPGEDLRVWLARATAPERDALLAAVQDFVRALHQTGFRDRNLDPRNLLARRRPDGGFTIAKIDSPRHLLTRPGRRADRLAREDLARLHRGLRDLTGSGPPR